MVVVREWTAEEVVAFDERPADSFAVDDAASFGLAAVDASLDGAYAGVVFRTAFASLMGENGDPSAFLMDGDPPYPDAEAYTRTVLPWET